MAELRNNKHEIFAQGVANGLDAVAAFRAAFPNSLNWEEDSVIRQADKLMSQHDIVDRIAELQDVDCPAILSRHDRMVLLTQIALNGDQPTRQRMNAIDLLNKMDGEYVKKIEATVTNDFDATASDIAAILAETDDED